MPESAPLNRWKVPSNTERFATLSTWLSPSVGLHLSGAFVTVLVKSQPPVPSSTHDLVIVRSAQKPTATLGETGAQVGCVMTWWGCAAKGLRRDRFANLSDAPKCGPIPLGRPPVLQFCQVKSLVNHVTLFL